MFKFAKVIKSCTSSLVGSTSLETPNNLLNPNSN